MAPQRLAQLSPRKLALVFFVAIFGGAVGSMSYLYSIAVEQKQDALHRHVRDLTVAAAAMIDVETHEQLVAPEQFRAEAYRRALAPLLKMHASHSSIQYLWTVRVNGKDEQCLVLQTSVDDEIRGQQVTAGRSQDLLEFLGPNTETPLGRESVPMLRSGRPVVFPGVYEDEHGAYIEARAPLQDAAGKFIGYVGIDYALDSYQRQLNVVRFAGAGSVLLALLIALVVARSAHAMRTETLRYLREAQEQRDRAHRANEAKSELLRIASHDLKNPLSSIAGMSELMLNAKRRQPGAEAAEEAETLDTIRGAARHMLEVVRGILTNEGLDTGAIAVKPAPCDLVPIVAAVVRFNAASAARKRQQLQVDLPAELRATADAQLLREAFDNYVSNAVKYSPLGARVIVRLAVEAGGWEFSVQDTGPGLSAEDQAKLFQKFRRLTPRPTGQESSTGLGLSIVKSIVEWHGGEVGCDSALGRGSRFWLRCSIAGTSGSPSAAATARSDA